MTEASIVQGRQIGAAELDQVRHLLASHPDWSRRRLSEELATLWNWRNGAAKPHSSMSGDLESPTSLREIIFCCYSTKNYELYAELLRDAS